MPNIYMKNKAVYDPENRVNLNNKMNLNNYVNLNV